MARRLDPGEQAELTEFINALFEKAGYATIAAWARDSGFPAPNLSKVRNRQSGIDGYNLLKLISAAALRAEVQAAELALGSAQRSVSQRLDELANKVAEAIELLQALADSQPNAGDGQTLARRKRK